MTLEQSYSVFEPEIWSQRINHYFHAKLGAANFFDDYSDEVTMGGDRIHIPHIGDSFSAATILQTNGAVTATSVSDTRTTLTLDVWSGCAVTFSDFQAAQVANKYNLKDKYAQEMGYKIAQAYDTAILANGSSLTPNVGDSATSILATSVEKALSILESRSVPLNECAFWFHPKPYWKEIYAVSKFYDASNFGLPVTPYGAHSTLYGIPVVITPQIPNGTAGTEGDDGHRNMVVHPSAIVHARGNLPGGVASGARLSEVPVEALRKKYVADLMYGDKILNANHGVRILSKT